MGEIIDVRRDRYGHSSGRNPDWSRPEERNVRACLKVLAEEGGNTAAAARRCKDEKVFPVSAWELTRWRDELFPKVWVDVHGEHEKHLEQIAEAQARTNAIRASVAASRAVERIDQQIDGADLLGASKALDSLVKAQGTSIDAVLKLSGRPVNGGSGGSAAETLRALEALGVLQRPVEGSIEEADVVSDETGDR